MRFDLPILLYGAGAEAHSTRAWLARTHPTTKVFVTADTGSADIDNAKFIAPDDLFSAITAHGFATIVKSPGVSLYKPVIAAARAAGIVITSNLNLWGTAYRKGRTMVAITGTKGKSTTATLCHSMLVLSDRDAGLAGNVGVPPLDVADRHNIVVFELSSYQTADMDFGPDSVGLTTLYPEHVDWHGGKTRYFADKLRLIDLNPAARLAFGPQAATHPLVTPFLAKPARLIPALDEPFDEAIRDAAQHSRLRGQHNIDNAILAARLAIETGATPDGILAAINAFVPLPHRLADLEIGGKIFVDDSIATTPEATEAALAAFFGQRIALIAGGFERQQDYTGLARTIGQSGVALVICLPETGARLALAVAEHAPETAVVSAPDLNAAMQALHLRRNQFDVAMLSPGAPSYNQFKNFAERGDAFIALAKVLFA